MTRKKPARKVKTIKSIEKFKCEYFPKSTYEELLRRVTALETEVVLLRARPFTYPFTSHYPYDPYPWDIQYGPTSSEIPTSFLATKERKGDE